MSRKFYAFLARATTGFHIFWTILLFGGGVFVLFYPPYALDQIEVMTLTGIFWFAFGLRCCLTIWAHYFEKKADIHDGDERPFTAKQLSKIFNINANRKVVGSFIALFYIASYTISVLVILHRWPL